MVSVLMAVGSGSSEAEVITRMLNVQEQLRPPRYHKCIGNKLMLIDVKYESEHVCWRYDEEALDETASILAAR